MQKYKQLFSNACIFTISSFGSKIISMLMLPFYTGILTTAEYGMADMIMITVTIFVTIFTLSISEAVLRYAIDENENKTSIFSTGLKITILSAVIIGILLLPLKMIVPSIGDYIIFFFLLYITVSTETLFIKFAKAIGLIKNCAIAGILSTVTIVVLNIMFLSIFELGIVGYLLSFICANFISGTYLFASGKFYKYFLFRESVNKKELLILLGYSIPFIPTAIFWWVNSASDRYIIALICGASATGLYSVANRIPSILNILVSIFQQAWQLSAIQEYSNNERENFYSSVYNNYNSVIIILTSVLIMATPIIAKLLFRGNFFEGWMLVPFLLIGAMFSGISGILGSLYGAAKKTGQLARSTIIGAIINVGLNFILIPLIGIIGAPIATAISFFLVYVTRYKVLKEFINISVNDRKIYLMYSLVFFQACVSSFELERVFVFILNVVLCFILIRLDFSNHKRIMKKVFFEISKNRKREICHSE